MKTTMRYGIKGFAIFCFLLSNTLYAVDVSIEIPDLQTMQDKQGNRFQAIYQGEPFTIKVTVANGGRDTGDVALEGLNTIEILGKSSSTNISIINSQTTSQKIYTYQAIADKAGVITVGPATVKDNGGTVSSKTLTFNVVEGSSARVIQQKQNGQQQAAQPVQPEARCFLSLTKNRIVIGESVDAVVIIATRGPVAGFDIVTPQFSGFLSQELSQQFKALGPKEISGKEYNLYEKRFRLTPLQQGTQELEKIQAAYAYQLPRKQRQQRGFFGDSFFSDFFQGQQVRQKNINSNAFSLTVDPLPAYAGRVDGVGQFTAFKASVDTEQIPAHQPNILRLELIGDGSLEQVTDLQLSLPSSVKYYSSKSYLQSDISTGRQVPKKVFEFIIQASEPGGLIIPEQKFTFFDVDAHEYRTINSEALTLNILPSLDQYAAPLQATQAKTKLMTEHEDNLEEKDIHFIEEDTLPHERRVPELPWWLLSMLLIVPLALLKEKWLVWFNVERFMRSKDHSKKRIGTSFKQLNVIIEQKKVDQLYESFMRFLGAHCSLDPHDVNEASIIVALKKSGWQHEKVDDLAAFLRECAGIRFASDADNVLMQKKLLKDAHYWLLLVRK